MTKNKGLIIIGYPGIGKSSLNMKDVIDLESSNFKINNERDPYWYKVYCKLAVSLALQGYTVLISSHEFVRKEMANYISDEYSIVVICPHYTLKDAWIKKLQERYFRDPSDKNQVAWDSARINFTESIKSIANDLPFSIIFIEDMDYDLYRIIRSIRTMMQPRCSLAYMPPVRIEEGC